MKMILATTVAVLASAAVSVAAAQAPGNPGAGARVFARCVSCHRMDAGGKHGIGPNLYRVVGRKAATATGFRYSPALAKSGITWTPVQLDAFLKAPRAAVPGTTMTFTGLADAKQRADVIAHIAATGK